MAVEIKFCGLTRAEDARQAVALGASFVGVIFAGGPRTLTLDRAREVLADVPPSVRRVGVFADQAPPEIGRIARELDLAAVQLHAESDAMRIAHVRREFSGAVWSVLRVRGSELPPDARTLVDAADGVLLDAHVPGALGGTGVSLPWSDLRRGVAELRANRQIILAGGLRPENVGAAIVALGPDVVDVSSGVEQSPGVKDHDRMRAFRDAVRNAFVPT
ncbi:MAG TPA: phosphoribosylanthranilate isomerase [Gemmatimonadaceae bacterium]|nr:phosphoribosylanthranilate isomerase [Gemmatimonadaceae bacterium]